MPKGVYIRTKSSWNKGLTKETDIRIVKYSENLKGKKHSIEHNKKISETKKGCTAWNIGLTKETDRRVAKQSKTMKGNKKTEEHKQKLSKIVMKRFKDPKEREKQSKVMKIVMNKPEIKAKHKVALNRPEVKAKMRVSATKNQKRKWMNPEYKEKQIRALFIGRNKKPNNLEKLFDDLTPNCIRYVGDGQLFITTKIRIHNPDFKVSGQKMVIELFGDYWHKKEDTNDIIKEYSDVGYKCLVLWESEIYDKTEEILAKVITFIKEE